MQLAYLFIEDFRSIKQQSFNFSSEFIFTTIQNERNAETEYSIHVDINPRFVQLFPTNILNVTGVIGKNGSGKSTLLNCIKLMTGQLELLISPLIFCYIDEQSKLFKFYYYSGGGVQEMRPLKINVSASTAVRERFGNVHVQGYKIKRLMGQGIGGLDFDFGKSVACCYFSNAFDSHKEVYYENILNLSTNHKLEEFLKEYIPTQAEIPASTKQNAPPILWSSHIAEFHKKELVKILNFISFVLGRQQKGLPKIPEHVLMEFKFDDYEALTTPGRTEIFVNIEQIQAIQKIAVYQIRASADQHANFRNLAVLCSFYYGLRSRLISPYMLDDKKGRYNFDELTSVPNEMFDKLLSLLSSSVKNQQSKSSKAVRSILGKRFDNHVKKILFTPLQEPGRAQTTFEAVIGEGLPAVLEKIFEIPDINRNSFIEFSWRGISTGEEAMLTQFSRLFEIRPQVKQKNIMLLIDEGDLYFHPQWQKKYLKDLLNWIKFIYPRKKVQIVLCSHSPFIASDLPKQNLLFLSTFGNGNCQVQDKTEQNETFGANIHELFTDSFYLSDGLMGEFARTNISALIDELNESKAISKEDYLLKYKNRIDIIGEDFLKAKLLELVAKKSELTLVDELIEQRILEIENLKKLRDTKRNDKDQ